MRIKFRKIDGNNKNTYESFKVSLNNFKNKIKEKFGII